jgi:heterodisulfide reductase subunit D
MEAAMEQTGRQSFADAMAGRIKEDVLDLCVACGKCVEVCPMSDPGGVPLDDSKAVTAGVLDILRGEEGNEAARRWVDVCTGSGYCISACDYGVNPRFMVKMAAVANRARGREEKDVRRGAVKTFNTMSRGVKMLSRLQLPPEVLARINPMSDPVATPIEDPEIVFYTGCNILKSPHIALRCLDILDALEVRYDVQGGTSHCCGIFHFVSGDEGTASRFATSTIEKLKAPGTAEVLSWCPSCQNQIGELMLPTYARATGEKPFDLIPFISYLDRRLDDLKPFFKHRVEKRVAINERPTLPGVMDQLKRVLRAVPGVEVVDLEVPRVGTMSNSLSVLPEFKKELREHEFRAAAEAGVDTLATVFHACHREICHFEKDVTFEIINFMEILGESMGITSEDVYKRLKIIGDVDKILEETADMAARYELPLDQLRAAVELDMFAAQPVGIADRSGR